jgi:hypothetical protein
MDQSQERDQKPQSRLFDKLTRPTGLIMRNCVKCCLAKIDAILLD